MNDIEKQLAEVRQQIDMVDLQILQQLKKRADLVSVVSSIKLTSNISAHQPKRFEK